MKNGVKVNFFVLLLPRSEKSQKQSFKEKQYDKKHLM